MLLFTPLLAGATENVSQELIILLLKGAIIIAVVMVSATYIVPQLLYHIVRTKSRELFLLSVVAICFAVAWSNILLRTFACAGVIFSWPHYIRVRI